MRGVARLGGLACLALGLGCGGSEHGPDEIGADKLENPEPGPWGENPRFSPPGGIFVEPFELTLTAEEADTPIRYTLDGSIPGPGAQQYLGPLSIVDSTRVRAAVMIDGQIRPPATHHYLRSDVGTASFGSALPLLVLDTHGAPAPDPNNHNWTPGSLAVFDAGPSGSQLGPHADQDLRVGFKVRGSSTRDQAKSSFALEVWTHLDDDDQDTPILGMPPGSDWVLFAPYQFDRTMIRNPLIYSLSNRIGRYAPRTRLVEVMLVTDGADLDEGAYNGVYVLMEKIKRGDDRVAIASLSNTAVVPPSITGGYILKIDRPAWDEQGFDAGGSENFDEGLNFVYPREVVVLPEQLDYIINYIDEFADAIGAADFVHPQTGLAYDEYIDIDAFIDHHILNVLAKNPDALRLSAFFFKDREGPLQAGPIWDFDRTMGSEDARDDDPQGWNPTGDGTAVFEFGWWGQIFQNPQFVARYRARWQVLLEGELGEDRVRAEIDALTVDLEDAAQRNYDRWPQQAPSGTHAEEVDALVSWLDARIAWIRGNVDALSPPHQENEGDL